MGINWIVSCCRRVKASTHKKYIALFVFLVVIVVWAVVRAAEWVIGFQMPQWAWNIIFVLFASLGLGWLDIFREIPHSESWERGRK